MLSDPPLDRFEVARIAGGLSIEGQDLDTYVKSAQAAGLDNPRIIETIKQHIIQEIQLIIQEVYAKP